MVVHQHSRRPLYALAVLYTYFFLLFCSFFLAGFFSPVLLSVDCPRRHITQSRHPLSLSRPSTAAEKSLVRKKGEGAGGREEDGGMKGD